MAVAQQVFGTGEVHLPYWSATIPIVWPKGNRAEQWVPFRIMCETIGVERKRQLSIVKRKYPNAIKMIPYMTKTGPRPALWIRRPECALWIGGIEPARCKITKRGAIEQFQKDFADAADKLLFEGPRVPPGKRGVIASSHRSEYIFSCLFCGGKQRLIALNDEVIIEPCEE